VTIKYKLPNVGWSLKKKNKQQNPKNSDTVEIRLTDDPLNKPAKNTAGQLPRQGSNCFSCWCWKEREVLPLTSLSSIH